MSQLSKSILMVRPEDFAYNAETGIDNEFQHKPDLSQDTIRQTALNEFSAMVTLLKKEGIDILVLEKNDYPYATPDAVFPNNWFSTEADGTINIFPMFAENRRRERRVEELETLLDANQFIIKNVIQIGKKNESKKILEGTGSMIIDHINKFIYMSLSQRSDIEQLENFVTLKQLKGYLAFPALSSHGKAIYHTNVIMSIGQGFAVICSECIPDLTMRNKVLERLKRDRIVIEITLEQMENNFCGNILNVANQKNESIIVMSQTAFNGFTSAQKDRLKSFGKLVPVSIDTIEKIGGGSARCMMAEIFLPKR